MHDDEAQLAHDPVNPMDLSIEREIEPVIQREIDTFSEYCKKTTNLDLLEKAVLKAYLYWKIFPIEE